MVHWSKQKDRPRNATCRANWRRLAWSQRRGLLGMMAVCSLLGLGAVPAHAVIWVYVTNNVSHTVSVIDTATNTVSATVPLGDLVFPEGVAVHPAASFVYVAKHGSQIDSTKDTVAVIHAATSTVSATVPVGDGPRGVAVHPAGTFVYVANSGDDTVSVINTSTNTVSATVPVGGSPAHVKIHPAGTFVYVANSGDDTVSVINTSTNTVSATVPVGEVPHGLAVHPAGTFLYVTNSWDNTVSIINTVTNTVVGSPVPVGSCPAQLDVHPAGTFVYVTSGCSTIDPGLVSVINTASNTVSATVVVGVEPHGVQVHPAGTFVYVANIRDDTVSVINTASHTVVQTIPVGLGGPLDFPVDIAILTGCVAIGPDLDNDGIADVCDPDIDNDGCENDQDQHPYSAVARSGFAILSPSCPPTDDTSTYAFEGGVDTDGDGVDDCADFDDDNDGLCDDNETLSERSPGVPPGGCSGFDQCPLHFGTGFICSQFVDCPLAPWWFTCFGTTCVEFFAKVVSVINPAPTIIQFDNISIVNQALYLFAPVNMSLLEAGQALAGNSQPRQTAAIAGTRDERLRLELWQKSNDATGAEARFVALVAEYQPVDVRFRDFRPRGVLAVDPTDLQNPHGSGLVVQTVWVPGARPGEAPPDVDGDGIPNPFDNCRDIANPGQIDTNGDKIGNRCDPDYNSDGVVGTYDAYILRTQARLVCEDPAFEPDVDANNDCKIGGVEVQLLRKLFNGPPGPSGLICPTDCPSLAP